MSIQDGQPVDALNSNAAWLSRKIDSDTLGKIALKNITDPNSGNIIYNIQRAVNELFDTDGVTGEGDANRKIYSSNEFISNGDDRKTAIGTLDASLYGVNTTLGNHTALSAGVHGVFGSVVGTTDQQDLKNKSYYFSQLTKVASYTASLDDVCISLDGTAAVVPITLPDPTTCEGKLYILKAINLTNACSVTNNVDGTPYIFKQLNEALAVISDGTAWRIFMSYYPVRDLAMVQGSYTDFAVTNITDAAYVNVVTLAQNAAKMSIVENAGGTFILRINTSDVGYIIAGEKTLWDFKVSSGDVIKIKSVSGTVDSGTMALNFFN
jgi:hypothetical protein